MIYCVAYSIYKNKFCNDNITVVGKEKWDILLEVSFILDEVVYHWNIDW